MARVILIKLRLLAICLIAVLCLSAPAMAIDYNGVGGLPANPDPNNSRTKSIFIYNLTPNQSKQDGIRVINNGESTKTIEVYAADSEIASGGSFACRQKVDPKKEVGSWIKFEKSQVTLAAGAEETVPFTITAPNDIGVGEHDGCVVIQEKKAAPNIQQGGVNISLRSALRVIVTVPGDIVKDLAINELKIEERIDKYIFSVGIINKGNVSLDANVQLRVRDIIGRTIYTNGGIYPVISRNKPLELNYEMPKSFWGGIYKAHADVEFDSDINKKVGEQQKYNVKRSSNTRLIFSEPHLGAILIYIAAIALAIFGIRRFITQKKHKDKLKGDWETYVTKKNDTLQNLATRSGVDWKIIAKTNKLKPPYHLEPKTSILLPPEIKNVAAKTKSKPTKNASKSVKKNSKQPSTKTSGNKNAQKKPKKLK